MTTKSFLVGFFLTASAVACSTAEAPATGDDQNVTAGQDACQTNADCVAVETLPCCSSKKEAFNKAFEQQAKDKALSTCMAAFCAPETDPPDTRVAACQVNKCVMIEASAPPPPPPAEGRKAAGFDFSGFKVAPLGGNEICPLIVDAVGEACREAGGKVSPIKTCATLCSVPVAERGKVAGFDFSGFRVANAAATAEICPAVLDPVFEACAASGGKSSRATGCATVCSVPVAESGKVAGYDFSGPKTLPAPAPGTACPEIVHPEEIACSEARGKVIEASECKKLCSTPIVPR